VVSRKCCTAVTDVLWGEVAGTGDEARYRRTFGVATTVEPNAM
jgi:hypothetical protein